MKRYGGRAGGLLRVVCLGMMLLVLPQAQASFSEIERVLPRSAPADTLANGAHAFLTILCKFADEPGEPEPPAFFERLLGADYPGLDHYWREVSYGRINLAGSKVIGWVTLPRGKSAYAGAEGAPNFQSLAEDCAGAADIEIDPGEVFGLNLVFNAELSRPHGGPICLAAARSTGCYGATWIWPFWFRSQATWAHEMGHALGLKHTGRDRGRQYDNVWDAMSNDGACGIDAEFGRLAQHVIAYHKDLLGWIPTTAKLSVAVPGEITFKLAPLATTPATGHSYLLAQIPIDVSERHFYTLEARTRVGYDRHLPADAVIIHEVDLRMPRAWGAGPAWLLWQGSAVDGSGAAVFQDDRHGITVEVGRQEEDGFTVTVRAAAPRAPDVTTTPTLPQPLAKAIEQTDQVPIGLAATAAEGGGVPQPNTAALAIDELGREHRLWIETNEDRSEAFYAMQQAGQAQSNAVRLDPGPAPGTMAEPALAAGAGRVAAAWLQVHRGRWQVHFAARPGDQGGWTRTERISSVTAGDARALAIAVDGEGLTYVLWQWSHTCRGARTVNEILLSTRTADGRWLAVEKVDAIPTTGSLDGLRLIADAAGNLYARWQNEGPEGTATYAAFRPDGGAWSSRWEVTGSHP